MERIEKVNYLFKTIVIGDGTVGKTSLTMKFAHGTFRERYLMTVGVEFAIKVVEIEGKTVKFQIWDTGGQERFAHVRPLYYRGAFGGILCFDLTNRKTFESLSRWIEEAQKFGGKFPFVLVGTKADLESQREISSEEIKEFLAKYNMPYYETSAKTGLNIEEVFTRLGLEILKNKNIIGKATTVVLS